jgi:hypothetical protein
MSEWRITDEQALAVAYEAFAMFEKEGDHRSMHHRFPEAAVRLGFVVPAQDDTTITDADGLRSCVTCLGVLPTPFVPAQDGEERLRADALTCALEHMTIDRWMKPCTIPAHIEAIRAMLAALETRPREESPE